VRTPRPTAKRPWSLRDRLTERDITKLITAYRNGATAASLATAHGLSLKSVKRLLRTAGVRRTLPHSTSYKGNAGRDTDGYPWSRVPALTSRFGFWHSWLSRCTGGAD
jgi:response regulator of citrate/malate metabolism